MSIELPATVSQYAEAAMVSTTTVRRALAAGHLVKDKKAKPALIVEGELTWTVDDWKKKLAPYLAPIKPHLRGWDGEGNLQILRGTQIWTIDRGYCEADLARAVRDIGQ